MNNNYSQINPSKFVDLMTILYSDDFSNQPTKMLWGQPGIGKSQAVYQLAENLKEKTGKEVNVKVVSLLLMNPIDLRGIPAKSTDDNGNDIAKWLPPDIFQMDPSENVINILFLDEISAAPPSVQAAAYQICLDKRIGEHKLPDNTFIICAGNRITDKAVAYKMPKPLANRLTHFEMIADLESWRKWAFAHNINSSIIGFITWKPNFLNQFNESEDDVAFPTPRSWELVNAYTKYSFKDMFDCIAGTVGLKAATELKTFITFNKKLPKFNDIIGGKNVSVDNTNPGLMYATASMIVANTIQHEQELTDDNKINLFNFITSFKFDEYVVLILKDLIKNCKTMNYYIIQNESTRKFIKKISEDLFD